MKAVLKKLKGDTDMELQEMIEYFFSLYGRRNRIFLSGLRKRISFLNIAIGDLQDAIRKGAALEVPLARTVSRVFCILENFLSLPLVEMMARKYPEHCAYCGSIPCKCEERRSEARIKDVASQEQMHWSLKQWQEHFNRLYGEHKNRKKGIDYIMGRLFKEVSELLSLQMGVSHKEGSEGLPKSIEGIEQEFVLEIADILSWIIAVANFYDVDLEKAVLDRYGHSCWLCKKNPCICGQFNYNPVKWDF